mgnify:CR=1 FL=1
MFGRRLRELKEDDKCIRCIHVAVDEKIGNRYQCRRFPPVKYKSLLNELVTDFPPVHPTDWCGEFQRKSTSYTRKYRTDYLSRY